MKKIKHKPSGAELIPPTIYPAWCGVEAARDVTPISYDSETLPLGVEQHNNTLYEWKTASDPLHDYHRALLILAAIFLVFLGAVIGMLVAVLG